jgi:hypothetical protein
MPSFLLENNTTSLGDASRQQLDTQDWEQNAAIIG